MTRRKGNGHAAGRRSSGKWLDFGSARLFYVQGEDRDGMRYFPTLAEVAEKFGISKPSIARHSSAEKWSEAREAYIAELDSKIQEERIEALAAKAVSIDVSCAEAAEAILALVSRRLTIMAKTFPDETPDEALKRIHPGILFELAKSLEKAQAVAKNAIGNYRRDATPELPSGEFTFSGANKAVADRKKDDQGSPPAAPETPPSGSTFTLQ